MSEPTVVCCDLDGVLWRGDDPIPGASAAVGTMRGAGLRVAFLTNNSSGTVEDYLAKLRHMGVDAGAHDLMTSAMAAADLLAGTLSSGARVLACAGAGVVEALEHAGFDVVQRAPADAVVVGWHRTFDFDGLARAVDAIRSGARFVATNTDPTYPVPGGVLPGNGAIVAAVATAARRRPEVAGKPERATVEMVRRRLGERGVVVGDRPSTDGALAAALGWPFAMVLSGIGGAGGEEGVPDPPPRWVADDLQSLARTLVSGLRAAAG